MIQKLLLCTLIVAMAATTATAQARKRTAGPAAAKAAAAKELRAGAEHITAESKVLATFLYRFGGVAGGITAAEKAAKENNAPAEVTTMILKNKASVAATVRNLVGGMQDLERYLALSPTTKPYFDVVNGLSQDIDLAADTAATGDLDGAAERLLIVLDNLNGALLPPAPPN